MRVDFYQLSRDPVEQVVPLLARKALQAGQRLLVVSGDGELRAGISRALWSEGGAHFLAHGEAGEAHEARQPILLSDACTAPNDARMVILADGVWREEAAAFERTFLLFDAAATQNARELWRSFRARDAIESHAWKQENGGWIEVG
ncbi:DNA polymerase III subunit chi [Erythrobacter sp. QSSC1-22B]|uniref:DNA polymerase III subunit chi n=1 Tax=Erythrobacter sp. QSSC1-22B TaxID=1860125 RepID=UPI0008051EA9|nr:DNA polymerase III subunit chi [Erythrobacter sp. QSSC1-22B]OBX20757.1 DNA polymerase III subunit chi [Erythrobacter sp. QSSC1-22B]